MKTSKVHRLGVCTFIAAAVAWTIATALLVPLPLFAADDGAAKPTDSKAETSKAPEASKAEASMPVTKKHSIESLLAMNKDQIIALWKTLPPASLEDLNGHYMGLVPNAGDKTQQASTGDYMFNENSVRGYWLGKAYKKTGPNSGEGYNRWRFPGGKVVRNLRFTTEAGKSLIDGKPSLIMYYGAFNDSDLVDELRKLDDYIFLGVGTRSAPGGKRSAPGHFILTGPTDEWVGGAEGTLKPNFAKPKAE